jgi:hypothetical protein
MGTSSIIGDTQKKMITLALTVMLIFAIIVLRKDYKSRACRGSCEQGRKPCDCCKEDQ